MNNVFVKNLDISPTFCNFETLDFDSVEWQTQKSQKHSVLFYNLNPGEENIKKFKERLTNTTYACCIVNCPFEGQAQVNNLMVVSSDDWGKIQKIFCDIVYPMNKTIKYIGFTGTNGKTTSVFLMSQLLILNGRKTLSFGTLGVYKNGKYCVDFGLTSPNYIDFRKYLHQYGEGVDYCLLEMSSHALDQNRFFDLKLATAAWTSFSQDHLDYHKDMNSYFESKKNILNYLIPSAHLNIYAGHLEIVEKLSQMTQVKHIDKKISSELGGFFKVKHNLINLQLALGCMDDLGEKYRQDDFKDLIPPPGRFDIHPYRRGQIIIDFAHTPDALENICAQIKINFKRKLIVIFGCGGDRDKSKRPLMAKAVQKYADEAIITSDNPRTERPIQIIEDVAQGFDSDYKYRIELDRKTAITNCLINMDEEVVLIAGKGHEDYIIIGEQKFPYSDSEVVLEVINRA